MFYKEEERVWNSRIVKINGSIFLFSIDNDHSYVLTRILKFKMTHDWFFSIFCSIVLRKYHQNLAFGYSVSQRKSNIKKTVVVENENFIRPIHSDEIYFSVSVAQIFCQLNST